MFTSFFAFPRPALCGPWVFVWLCLLLPVLVFAGPDNTLPRVELSGNPQIRQQGSSPHVFQPSLQDRRYNHIQAGMTQGSVPMAEVPGVGSVQMPGNHDWRLKINSSAITRGESVRLGEIAQPLGNIPDWPRLAQIELWAAPKDEGKPVQINRSNLAQALNERLGRSLAARCILPTSLVIQKNGLLIRENDLRTYVVKSLTPVLRSMPGEVEFTDFHLPEYIFLAHEGQRVQLEQPKLSAGRVGLRFAILEADGTILRRTSGSITITQWVTVPAAARALSKGEALTPEAVTFSRINAKRLKEQAWDGRGGPWQMMRSVPAGEPILQSDLATQMMIRRGDIVQLIYRRGNLVLQTQAEAMADGEPGATISVRNLQTKKQVFAIVKDSKTVEIN